MKNVVLVVTLVVAFILGACAESCSNDVDGDWTPMKWQTSVVKGKDGKIAVSSQGGSYVFICKNYNAPWLANLQETIGNKETYYYPAYDDNPYSTITSPWLTAQWKGNTLTITIAPNETGKEREMVVCVTAGDIFDTFIFKQTAAQ